MNDDCSFGKVCVSSRCINSVICDNGNPCMRGTFDPTLGCQYTPLSGISCTVDTDACTTEHCVAGICEFLSLKDCTDFNEATTDVCDTATGECGHILIPPVDGDIDADVETDTDAVDTDTDTETADTDTDTDTDTSVDGDTEVSETDTDTDTGGDTDTDTDATDTDTENPPVMCNVDSDCFDGINLTTDRCVNNACVYDGGDIGLPFALKVNPANNVFGVWLWPCLGSGYLEYFTFSDADRANGWMINIATQRPQFVGSVCAATVDYPGRAQLSFPCSPTPPAGTITTWDGRIVALGWLTGGEYAWGGAFDGDSHRSYTCPPAP